MQPIKVTRHKAEGVGLGEMSLASLGVSKWIDIKRLHLNKDRFRLVRLVLFVCVTAQVPGAGPQLPSEDGGIPASEKEAAAEETPATPAIGGQWGLQVWGKIVEGRMEESFGSSMAERPSDELRYPLLEDTTLYQAWAAGLEFSGGNQLLP